MEISCEENINKSTTKEVEEKNMQVITNQKQKPKKNLLFKLIIIISILIIISIIIALMILFIRKKKKKIYFNFDDKPSNPISNNITDFQNLLAEKKNNSITMLYSLQKKKDSVLFNPEKINLTKGEYEIEVLSLKDEDNNSISRKLNDIDYKFISDINGQMEIRITFFVQLTSMSELFKGCRNLLEVDLSNLDGSKLTDANSVFENVTILYTLISL